VRFAALAQRRIPGATLWIVLGGDTGPVIDNVAQSDMRSLAHDNDMTGASLAGQSIRPNMKKSGG